MIIIKLMQAYTGHGETKFFAGSAHVGSVQHIEGWYLPMIRRNGVSRFGRAMKTMEGARAWIQMTIKHGAKK